MGKMVNSWNTEYMAMLLTQLTSLEKVDHREETAPFSLHILLHCFSENFCSFDEARGDSVEYTKDQMQKKCTGTELTMRIPQRTCFLLLC